MIWLSRGSSMSRNADQCDERCPRVNMFAMENDMSFYEALERVQAVRGSEKRR